MENRENIKVVNNFENEVLSNLTTKLMIQDIVLNALIDKLVEKGIIDQEKFSKEIENRINVVLQGLEKDFLEKE